jgi:hypothetical protein
MHVRIEREGHGHRFPRTPAAAVVDRLRIVGSVREAAGIVQEAFLHFTGNRVRMRTRPAQGLSTVTTRLAIDQARSRGHQGGLSRSQACCTASSASLSGPSIR